MPASPPWWHPASFTRRRPFLEIRGRLQAEIRGFFANRGYTEVETPALQVSPGPEPHLFAFATEWRLPAGEPVARYLHTSPELAMKKLLVAGSGPIFQFAQVFRNGEAAATHAPEFTMLEWYRPGADYRDLIAECTDLLALAGRAAGRDGLLRWRGQTADPAKMAVLTVAEAFERYAGIDLMASLSPAGQADAEALRRALTAVGLRSDAGDSWDDLFFRVVLEKIEPHLGFPHPTALCDYPLPLGALARPKPEDGRLVERFELYVAGLELANAFGELCDADEQARRFRDFAAEKRARYGFAYPADEDFLAALRHGMPASAGIALGFDRLVMLASGAERIEDVLWAPVR